MNPLYNILEEAQNGEIFIEALVWGENGLEFTWTYKDEQTENVASSHRTVVLAETEERAEAYRQLQDLAQWVLDDGLEELSAVRNKV